MISSVGLAPRCSEVAYKKQLLVFRVTVVVDFCNFIGIILIRMRPLHTNWSSNSDQMKKFHS